MDGPHVLRLAGHVIDMFHRCSVVQKTDLPGHTNMVISRKKMVGQEFPLDKHLKNEKRWKTFLCVS